MVNETNSIESFKEFVKLYRETLGKAVSYLNAKSLAEPGFQTGPNEGFLNESDNITYWFHGVGCDINMNGLIVVIDFGLFDRLDLIDPYNLLGFLNRNESLFKEKYRFNTKKEISFYLEKLVDESFLIADDLPYYDHVYIFPDDYHASDKLRWVDPWGDAQVAMEDD